MRGDAIHHYTSFVLEDHGAQLPSDGREMLETVKTLALRIDELLSSLLQFSAIGRVEVASHPTSLDRRG